MSDGAEGTGWNGSSTICSPAVRIVSLRKMSGMRVASDGVVVAAAGLLGKVAQDVRRAAAGADGARA